MKNNSHQDLVSNQRNVYNVIYETNYRTWRKSYMDLTKLTAYEIIEHRPLPDLKSEGLRPGAGNLENGKVSVEGSR